MKFEIKSLGDLAEYFDDRAVNEMTGPYNKRLRSPRAAVWREAADIIRHTTIAPPYSPAGFNPDDTTGDTR